MTQFALMTSEGWTETMYDTMHATSENENFGFYQYFIPIYFIFSHMFCSLVTTTTTTTKKYICILCLYLFEQLCKKYTKKNS